MLRPGTSCSARCTVPNLRAHRISARCAARRTAWPCAPRVLALARADDGAAVAPAEAEQLEVPPVLERARAVAGQDEEEDGPERDEREREQHDELADLPERERAVDRREPRRAEARDRVRLAARCGRGCREEVAPARDEVLEALVDEHLRRGRSQHCFAQGTAQRDTYGVEDVDERLVDEERLEDERDDRGALAKHEQRAVHPRERAAVEDREERDLREVRPAGPMSAVRGRAGARKGVHTPEEESAVDGERE
jgi:hypothetical protein